MKIGFKYKYLKKQWGTLLDKNPELVIIALSFAYYFNETEIIITSIHRPKNKKSVHAYWRGIDLRSRNLNQNKLSFFVDFINRIYPYKKGKIKTAIVHDSGKGEHIHLQTKSL